MESNLQEIDDEIEALKSVMIEEFEEIEEDEKIMSIEIDGEPKDAKIVKAFRLKIFPEDSVPAKLTKIISTNSAGSVEGASALDDIEEHKNGESHVKIRIWKMEYLPPLVLEILMPETYPSITPPLFKILKNEFYSNCEDVIAEKLKNELWEPGVTCMFELQAYIQWGFIEDYMKQKELTQLKCMASTKDEYNDIMALKRESFINKLSKEEKTCMICYESYFGNGFYVFSNCSHYFCTRCIKEYCKNLIENGNIVGLICPDLSCKKQIWEEDIQQLVTEELYGKYIRFDLYNQVNADENLTWCPVTECGGVAKIKGGNMFGECTECEFRFCLTCNLFYHSGKRCPVLSIGAATFKRMSKADQVKFIADHLNELYIKKYSKNCPHCAASIAKIDGCNKMVCYKCGKYFCWAWNKGILGYEHFEISPECWGKQSKDRTGITEQDIEEAKESMGDMDMNFSIAWPHCNNITKKKTESNLITCDKCDKTLCYQCGKPADEEHFIKYSCLSITKVEETVNTGDIYKTFGFDS